MLLFSGPCNSLPNFPTFHFHAESSAQYLMFIFSAQCNLSPDFPICHPHATSSAQYLISILSEQHNSITPFINVAPPCSIRSPIFDKHFLAPNIIHQYHSSTNITPAIPTCPMLNLLPNISYTYLGE